jgi:transcriptional regulator with XRE-family HTH domain
MHHLKETRLQWGISQSDFADLLGCTRSQLAMAETGKRHLNTAASLMIHRMESTKPNAYYPYPAAAAATDERHLKALEHDFQGRYIKLYRLERLAEKLAAKMQQCLNLAAMAAALMQTEPVLAGIPRMRLQVLERQAKSNLSRWQKQWLLCQVDIAGQQAAMAKAKALMAV